MYNPYNQQMYMNDLQGMRDRIDRQIQQMNNQQPQQQAPITQNFQIAPNQGTNNSGIKYVTDDEQVKNELVFSETLFVNKEYTKLWVKNVAGKMKKYELKEIVELDEKDLVIANLQSQIEQLKGDIANAKQSNNSNDDETNTVKKPTRVSNNK